MQKASLWTLIVLLMAALFAGGLIIGLGANEPDVAALRAETEEQQDELTSLQSRLSQQDSQLATLRTELGDADAERSSLAASLDASRSTVRDLEQNANRMAVDLSNAQTQLDRTKSSLQSTEERNRNLQLEVLAIGQSQRNIGLAFELLSELEEITISKFEPNHGDALLLVEEGYLAANNGNLSEAAVFFRESSKAYDLAKTYAAEVTAKSQEIVELVPEEVNQTFVTSHRQYRSTIFAMEAQARTFEAADHLYTIVSEWEDTESPTSADKARWRDLANQAEDQFELAMVALDEADTWSPGLWRRTEAFRLNTRDWRNLLRGIRINIIDRP